MPSKKRKTKPRKRKSKAAIAKPAKKAREGRAATKKTVRKRKSKKLRSSRKGSTHNARTRAFRPQRLPSSAGVRRGTQLTRSSGDFEGLSRVEDADSESVDELVEEGNAFEGGVVAGVEEADDQDSREVHTHEVLEDDVPDEYLEND